MEKCVRGDFVQNTARNRGVVDSVTAGFAYVAWFMSYDSRTGATSSFLEYININEIECLPKEQVDVGLEALRLKIIR